MGRFGYFGDELFLHININGSENREVFRVILGRCGLLCFLFLLLVPGIVHVDLPIEFRWIFQVLSTDSQSVIGVSVYFLIS